MPGCAVIGVGVRQRLPSRLLRGVITVQAVTTFTQSALAGAFLDGHFAMLRAHRLNAYWGVVGVSYVQMVLALVLWRRGTVPRWVALVCVGLAVADSVEVMLGLGRVIGLHLPFGVAIITANALLAAWAWRDRLDLR